MPSQNNDIFRTHEFGAVAILAWDTLAAKEALDYLTEAEIRRLGDIKNEERRKKWLVGRIAGKYLYLNRMRESDAWPGLEQSFFMELTRGHIETFATSMYRCVEILPDIDSSSNIPRIFMPGVRVRDPLSISISHTDSLSCVCLAQDASIGVDLEKPAFRLDAFYRTNFTNHEKEWARRVAGKSDISPQWLYTVLWSLKESALKSSYSAKASVWNIPNIEIDGLSEVTDWGKLYRHVELGSEFLYFSIGVSDGPEKKQVRVALTATRHMVLVILNAGETMQ